MSSGVHVVASGADFDQFARQEAEATGFLRNHFEQLRRLRTFPGVESVTLDFGIERRNVYLQCDSLSPELIAVAGSLGVHRAGEVGIAEGEERQMGEEPD